MAARGNIGGQFGGIVDAQLDAAQLLGVTTAEFLEAGAEKPELEGKAHVEQSAHCVDAFVALQLFKPEHHVFLAGTDHGIACFGVVGVWGGGGMGSQTVFVAV